MKVLIPLVLGIFLAVGIVKLSRSPEAPRDPSVVEEGQDPEELLEEADAFGLQAGGGAAQTSLALQTLRGLGAALGRGDSSAASASLKRKMPEESERRRAFEALLESQLGTSGPTLETVDALLRGASLDEENLSNGVLFSLGESDPSHDPSALQALGLTQEECAALAREAVAKGWL